MKTQGIHVTEWPDLKAQSFAGINPVYFGTAQLCEDGLAIYR